jgi:hypothetical protein
MHDRGRAAELSARFCHFHAPRPRGEPPNADGMKQNYATADRHNGLPTSDDDNAHQPRRSKSLMEQLRKDVFDEFKTDLCLELDCLGQPADSPVAESQADSSYRARNSASDDAASDGVVSKEDVPSEEATRVRHVLRQWAEQDKAARYTNHLYYRLDHKYTDGRICLRPRDRVVVKTLGRAAKDLQLDVFFACLIRDDGTPAPNYQARSLIDLQGHELIKKIPIAQPNWVQRSLPSLNAHAPDWEVVSNYPPSSEIGGRPWTLTTCSRPWCLSPETACWIS